MGSYGGDKEIRSCRHHLSPRPQKPTYTPCVDPQLLRASPLLVPFRFATAGAYSQMRTLFRMCTQVTLLNSRWSPEPGCQEGISPPAHPWSFCCASEGEVTCAETKLVLGWRGTRPVGAD